MKNFKRVFGVIISVELFIFAGVFFAAPDLVIASNRLGNQLYPAVETWDLIVTCKRGYNPSANEWDSIKKNFRRASNFLYDATDGQVKLRTIRFSTNSIINYYLADFVISKYSVPEAAIVDGNDPVTGKPVRKGYIKLGGRDENHHDYGSIVHELGHYKFDLGDEYTDMAHRKSMICRSNVRHGSLMDVEYHHSLDPTGTSEFCTPSGGSSQHKPMDERTAQAAPTWHDTYWSWLGNAYTSAWTIINRYNNAIRIPAGDPDPGPCSKSNNRWSEKSHEPLEAHQGTAKFVILIGP